MHKTGLIDFVVITIRRQITEIILVRNKCGRKRKKEYHNNGHNVAFPFTKMDIC